MSRSTCIPLYPATDGRQTGDNFVADTRYMPTSGYKWIQLVSGNMTCPGVNAALLDSKALRTFHTQDTVSLKANLTVK